MSLSEMGRKKMASILSLAMVLGLTACTRDYTVAYLYVTSAKGSPGVVNEYAVDYQTGALTTLSSASIAAGNDPVTLVTSPSGLFLYVINQGDSTVQEFAVGGYGVLSSKTAYKTVGNTPTAAAIDPAGKFLYVTTRYQGTSTSGQGAVSIFPINGDNSLGTPSNINVGNNPVGIVASNFNNFVYVLDQEKPINSSPVGVVLGYSENPSTGTLTPTTGGTVILDGVTIANGYPAGVIPSAIAEDPTARFVYVTDQATNQLFGNIVVTNGGLVPMTSSPFSTGLFPLGLTIDPRGKYLYVANYSSGTVGAYAIDPSTGTPVGAVGSSSTAVDPGPTCVTIEPALGIYLYSSNNLGGSVSGMQLDPHNGTLKQIQGTPFNAAGGPTCAVAIANGAHATQLVTP